MDKDSKTTEKITISGVVQGVGFRPFVAKLAAKMDINGHIKNMGGFVQLVINDPKEKIDRFVEEIQRRKPPVAEIVHIEREMIPHEYIKGFSIIESEMKNDEIGMIPADIAICDDCIAEFYDPDNPRYKHPFISCTVCGPRYTIIDSLPYDRKNTAMDEFPMCDFCKEQYGNRESRRYHSQTISCHVCGPMPEYHTPLGSHIIIEPGDPKPLRAIKAASSHVKGGKVIALKGTGGYYFVCSPFIDSAVKKLRDIKVREEKPFAVMFKDMDSIKEYCLVNSEEAKLLTSGKRPIVLLEKKQDLNDSKLSSGIPQIVESVCRSSRYIGAFLPSFGLQYQLIDETGPLIMTSANLSDQPIIYDDDDMLDLMNKPSLMNEAPQLAGVLLNRRKIRMSLDDSVARIIDGNPQLTRRSKGYAPVPIYVNTTSQTKGFDKKNIIVAASHQQDNSAQEATLDKTHMIFATGGQLKSAFSLSKGNFAYISQHFGDLDSIESQDIYEANFYRMKKFFGICPDLVVCDMHPLYNTTRFAEEYVTIENQRRSEEYATKDNQRESKSHVHHESPQDPVKLIKVQHHHAHIASVMAEHGLSEPVIGVSFDGTGYGTDGNIWGGEFLICKQDRFERYSHLAYVDMIGGDSSMKEGWKSAVSHMLAAESDSQNRTAAESESPNQLQAEKQVPPSPEPVEVIKAPGIITKQLKIDISDIIAYSISEETLADFTDIPTVTAAIKNKINTVRTSSMGRLFDGVASLLGIQHINRYEGECAIMLENAACRAMTEPNADRADVLALEFHRKIADCILNQCQTIRADRQTHKVALSGGVFQNKILMEYTLKLLRNDGFDVYYNSAVPTNDGGISLGQNYIGMWRLIKEL